MASPTVGVFFRKNRVVALTFISSVKNILANTEKDEVSYIKSKKDNLKTKRPPHRRSGRVYVKLA